jgi:hypothetical protein
MCKKTERSLLELIAAALVPAAVIVKALVSLIMALYLALVSVVGTTPRMGRSLPEGHFFALLIHPLV